MYVCTHLVHVVVKRNYECVVADELRRYVDKAIVSHVGQIQISSIGVDLWDSNERLAET